MLDFQPLISKEARIMKDLHGCSVSLGCLADVVSVIVGMIAEVRIATIRMTSAVRIKKMLGNAYASEMLL